MSEFRLTPFFLNTVFGSLLVGGESSLSIEVDDHINSFVAYGAAAYVTYCIPAIINLTLSERLCGMSYIQVYTYFTHTGSSDRLSLRCVVSFDFTSHQYKSSTQTVFSLTGDRPHVRVNHRFKR